MGYMVDTARKAKCPGCKKVYMTNWIGTDYCSMECEEEVAYARVGTVCGGCGDVITRGIYNIYGGEIQLDTCGCEGSGEF